MEVDDSFPRVEVGEPSSAAEARVTEGIQSGVLDMVNVEGRLFGLESSIDRNMLLEMRTQTNIAKRELGLKDAGVAWRIACSIQLLRDSLSLNDVLDQSMINSIRVSSCILNWFADDFGPTCDLG